MGPVTIVLGLFVIWAAFVVFQFVMTRREARDMFELGRERGEIDAGEAYPPFERAYLRCSDLRVNVYRWLGAFAAVIALPVALWLVNMVWSAAYYAFDRPAALTEGELVHSFALAIFSFGALICVAAIFALRYHMYRPVRFEEEWMHQKAGRVTKAARI